MIIFLKKVITYSIVFKQFQIKQVHTTTYSKFNKFIQHTQNDDTSPSNTTLFILKLKKKYKINQ